MLGQIEDHVLAVYNQPVGLPVFGSLDGVGKFKRPVAVYGDLGIITIFPQTDIIDASISPCQAESHP
jgi:hypothetical protein